MKKSISKKFVTTTILQLVNNNGMLFAELGVGLNVHNCKCIGFTILTTVFYKKIVIFFLFDNNLLTKQFNQYD